ncbi:MAG: membrane protein insertion efficiency factor YidD [Gallionella sp.]|nr:membrane protein insertion efficiency factor YidD [Gallionella sp.]MDD4945389.1 membrane protein insertion efficiency factor YidD [Gallionella sp.]
MRRFLITVIHGYQYFISPLKPPTCRFIPTCSDYACQALTKYGLLRGIWMSLKRLARCNPWHSGGYDPIP